MSFYLLADADEALTEPTGYHRHFRDDLIDGPVLTSEISDAIKQDNLAIRRHDSTDFVERVRRHASMAALVESGEAREPAEQLTDPRRGTIPLAVIDGSEPANVHRGAEEFLLSLGTAAAMARDFAALDSIVAQGLAAPEITGLHPLLQRMGGDLSAIASDRDGVANAI